MSGSVAELPVAEDEWLAHYILRGEHVRADGTVKPDPFIPYKWVELSVTRHLDLSEKQIWEFGQLVAAKTAGQLYGRANAQAAVFMSHRLRVMPAPLRDNANHANVVDWPPDKQAQKEIALEIVKQARYKSKPRVNG